MNKTELVAAIADEAGLSKKDAEKALKAFTDVVTEELKKGEKVQLVGFGTFEVSERSAREGRNPQTGIKGFNQRISEIREGPAVAGPFFVERDHSGKE